MEVRHYLGKMNEIQNTFLKYIDDENDSQEEIQKLIKILKDFQVLSNKHMLTSTIHFIASIIDYHYRTNSFFKKIFQIILFLKDEIKKNYSNFEIFNFFKNNKKVLLFLSQEKILIFDQFIISKMYEEEYEHSLTLEYLYPEIKDLIKNDKIISNAIPENIEELRKEEYSDCQVLQYIQNDQLDEFINFVNRNDFELDGKINKSQLFETNLFIMDHIIYSPDYTFDNTGPKPIEYAAFFGSLNIFKYLVSQKCSLEPKLWLYAIHGRQPEIIHFLESNKIQPIDTSYKECLSFSIDCHHNELTQYILSNYIENEDKSFIFTISLESYNFELIHHEMVNSDFFYELCENDYFILVDSILQSNPNLDVNKMTVKEGINEWTGDQTKSEKTPLFIASERGNNEIVQLLLNNKNIDVNKKSLKTGFYEDKTSLTPLFIAIKQGHQKVVESLLNSKNIDPNMKSINGVSQKTPLYTAIAHNNIEIVRLLIERDDVDVNLKSMASCKDYGEYTNEYHRELTPLFKAVECENLEIVKLLIENKKIELNAIVTIQIYTYENSIDEVSEPRINEKTALFEAVLLKNVEIVKLFISQKNIDVNITSKFFYMKKLISETSILQKAVINNISEIVKLLLGIKNIDVNKKITNNIDNIEDNLWDDEIVKSKKLDIQKHANESGFGAGFSSDINEKTILHVAIENENDEIVSLLLKNDDIDVNTKSFYKTLNYFIQSNQEREEKKLEEFTPLYLAVDLGNIKIVQLLIDYKKIDANIKSTHYEFLFEKFIDVENQQNKENSMNLDYIETALHNAVRKGNVDIIKLLLGNKNVDVNVIDKQGRKPIELTKNEEIINVFMNSK